jgi:hypothetical protein
MMDDPGTVGDPHGIDGWLILPLLALIIYSFYQIFALVDILGNATGGLGAALNLGAHPFQWSLALIVLGEIILNLILLLLEGFILFCLVKKKQIFPKLMIAWLIMLVVAAGINPILAKAVTTALNKSDNIVVVSGDPSPGYDPNPLMRATVHCVIWIFYFLKSRRVKLTFIN